MLLSKLLGERFKEKPQEAKSISHIFLLRGGYIRQVANGLFTMLLPAQKVKVNIEKIIREEMNKIDGQEVIFPVVLPGELWQESGRFESVGSELLRMKDRTDKDLVLGMTHEEAAVHLARSEAKSYTQYPFMIYQIQTKFRDEARSRGGLIRVREFTMKDAYSFHTSNEDLDAYYDKCLKAYNEIYRRTGVPEVVCVESDSGMMGGNVSHEFMLLADIGEDTIVVCDSCGYMSNMEVATGKLAAVMKEEKAIEKIHTPKMNTIADIAKYFGVSEEHTLKAAVYNVQDKSEPLVIFIRGDLQVNIAKVQKIVKAAITPYEDYENCDLAFGFIGPYKMNTDKVTVIYDKSLKDETNLICGGNEADYHYSGLNMNRDLSAIEYVDVAEVKEGQCCPNCNGKLTFKRGIEVGNIFKLGTKYTDVMKMTYVDQDGKSKTPIMGCYGIGVGRLIASAIEAHHDDYGPIWPISIAPWQVHICALKSKTMDINAIGAEIYGKLSQKFEVIFDDRGAAPGVQFADADLLGVPVRIVLGEKNLKNGNVEIVTRDKSIKKLIAKEDVYEEVAAIIRELQQRL